MCQPTHVVAEESDPFGIQYADNPGRRLRISSRRRDPWDLRRTPGPRYTNKGHARPQVGMGRGSDVALEGQCAGWKGRSVKQDAI